MDTTAWTIEQQADWHLLMAEMNGFDFNFRILKPWERDPAFYKSVWTERSDVPAHEGPTHHMITD
jgi:alpha-N-acetylglucosamine transferase